MDVQRQFRDGAQCRYHQGANGAAMRGPAAPGQNRVSISVSISVISQACLNSTSRHVSTSPRQKFGWLSLPEMLAQFVRNRRIWLCGLWAHMLGTKRPSCTAFCSTASSDLASNSKTTSVATTAPMQAAPDSTDTRHAICCTEPQQRGGRGCTMTSTWIQSQPASSTAFTCSAVHTEGVSSELRPRHFMETAANYQGCDRHRKL